MREVQPLNYAITAIALGSIALAGCATSGTSDFVAAAPESAVNYSGLAGRQAINERIAYHAKANKIPESLVHAAVRRESKYNPTLKHGPFWGLMQIRYDTARSMGYSGSPSGLLDPEANLTYGVAYLANAYLVAGGDERRALRLYASGYYYEAKRRGLLGVLQTADASAKRETGAIETESSQ
jgi:soluble lytic murein transglycosylase-like protein